MTIDECEEPAVEREDSFCATSLETIVYSTSELGTNTLQVVSAEANEEENHWQDFSITPAIRKIAATNTIVVSHAQHYVYPMFYCHASHTTIAYLVPLLGANGTSAKVIVVFHTNTSKWNPKHLAFQVLRPKAGTVPICPFPSRGSHCLCGNVLKGSTPEVRGPNPCMDPMASSNLS
ncbi:BURP domain protein RD22-like [Malania oleifera]|uniref:BURP domain protein RD22-like n=1 Tax=Malania oleifera TaxID=397392 RepID=UPI0025ADFBD4|nr:BURP domain protein RD22-like [Malania oleifera]